MAHSGAMCVAFLRVPSTSTESFILAANRDEFLDRPSAPAEWWADAPSILGGRDLKEGGTWLAVSRTGRFALITNFRDPKSHREGRLSRGTIIPDFLNSGVDTERYLAQLTATSDRYNPFNLVAGDLTSRVWFFSSRERKPELLAPGVHGVSNGDLHSDWPKVTQGRGRFESIVRDGFDPSSILELMADRGLALDSELPSTGVPKEVERSLSAIFIRLPGYGTRCTTLLRAEATGNLDFFERTYSPDGSPASDVNFSFDFRQRAE